MFKSGFVAIVGSPNAGKSSLINKIFNQKISIVSDKVQTTRDMIKGIYNDENSQIVFLDTPGFHHPQNKLQVYMNHQIEMALTQLDLLIYVVDAEYGMAKKEINNLKNIENKTCCKRIALVNKLDLISQEKALKIITQLDETGLFDAVSATSIRHGFNRESFIKEVKSYLSDDYRYYEDEQMTDYSDEFYIEEIIREKINNRTFEEIPHSVAVKVKEMQIENNILHILVDVYVERDSQKGIIIGRGGQSLKEIGKKSRVELKKYFATAIYLDIHVKVLSKWAQQERSLDNLGYFQD